MSIKVNCPACDEVYRLADDKAGKDVRCRRCNEIISVPDPDPDESRRRRPVPVSESQTSGSSTLYWVLGIVGGVLLLLTCGVVGCFGFMFYAAGKARENIEARVQEQQENFPGTEPKDINQALNWLDQGNVKAENAAKWLVKQPVDASRRAEVVGKLDRAYQAPGVNIFPRNNILDALAAWAGPGDTPLLVRSLDGGANDKVVDFLVKHPTPEGARAAANLMNSKDMFKGADMLRKMGPVAEDAAADLTLNGQNVTVKVQACSVLEQIGTRKSVPKVQQAIQNEGALKYNGEQAIKKMQNR
jgi:predicted Zn finger-like uncharacterized protein